MSDGGKGSARRPSAVSDEVTRDNWERIFGKKAVKTYAGGVPNYVQDLPCKTDPRAPHGFLRNESHTQGRYVCECEFWNPPEWEFK